MLIKRFTPTSPNSTHLLRNKQTSSHEVYYLAVGTSHDWEVGGPIQKLRSGRKISVYLPKLNLSLRDSQDSASAYS